MGRPLHARRALGVATLLACLGAFVACGSDEPPAEAVPALAEHLEQVDDAIADERPGRARRAVEELVDEATRARMDGSITAEQADEILRAAGRLLDRLGSEGDSKDAGDPTPPADSPDDVPDGEDAEEPEPATPPEDDSEDDGEDKEDDPGEKHGDKDKDKDKDRGKGDRGHGGGNGPPGGNGPDDGHGN